MVKNVLTITVPSEEIYDEQNNVFDCLPEVKMTLEHSLLSISKWEIIWHKPFLSDDDKSHEEEISYVKCMTLSDNIDDKVYERIDSRILDQIDKYINDSQTALFIPKENNSKEFITSEYIYYWMAMNNIPFECEKWHLNRLLSLIYLCHAMNSPKKKKSESEIIAEHRQLNKMRRSALNTKG